MKYYNFKGNKVYLQKDEYRNNGTIAVLMYKKDDELYGCLTVNLNHPLQSDSMAFLDENNMPGIGKWIENNGLGTFTGVRACSGFCVYLLYQLDFCKRKGSHENLRALYIILRRDELVDHNSVM